MTNYEFTKVSPQQLMLQIRYTKDGCPDYWVNLRTGDFSEDKLHQLASNNAYQAERYWETISQLPQEVVPAQTAGVIKDKVPTIAPEYDPLNEDISFEWVETGDTLTQSWTVTEKNEEGKTQALNEWRQTVMITMRQYRLALAQEGLLQTAEDAIALISEPDRATVSIEWEYSTTVERNAQWVATHAAAIGLTDTQLDDLFHLGITL
jgi:hypothetical protein